MSSAGRRAGSRGRAGSPEQSGPQTLLTRWRAGLPALIVGAFVSAVYALFSVRQWARFDVPSWDQGIFTQLMRAYSELRSPVVPIKGEGFMLLGDHFHPLLVILAPFYALWPSGLTLLVAQAALVGISAGVVAWCALRHLGLWPGLAVGMAYGLSWGLQSAVASQFHEIALALPFLALSLSALVNNAHRAAALWALPLLAIKEDLGLTVAVIGVVIALRGSRRLGMGLAAAGVIAFGLTVYVILPWLNVDGVWDYAEDSIVSMILSDPGAAMPTLFTGFGAKLLLVLLTLGITGFLAVRSPLVLITLPTFAWRLTSDVPFHWGTDWHYSAVLMPVVFLAAVDVLRRRRTQRRLVPLASAFMALAALVLTTQFPLADLARAETYSASDQHAGAIATMAAIPDDAVVVSDITMLAYLAPRTEVYWLSSPGAPVPEYVVIDQHSGVHRGDPPASIVAFATERFGDYGWVEVVSLDGFLVAERTG